LGSNRTKIARIRAILNRVRRSRKFKQGVYRPSNPEKYKGSYPILYRSSYEKKLFDWLNRNPSVISWGSESVVIPYQNPLTGRISRYFVDVNFTCRDVTGATKKFLVEVKPSQQTMPPKQTGKNTKALVQKQCEYAKNMAKWTAARQWCQNHGYDFQIVTEKHLGIR